MSTDQFFTEDEMLQIIHDREESIINLIRMG